MDQLLRVLTAEEEVRVEREMASGRCTLRQTQSGGGAGAHGQEAPRLGEF